MLEKFIFAGFGGQGALLMGQLITYAGMLEGKEVSWLPSYGPEMRGGTANCSVVVSNEPVASPIVTVATGLVVLNRPSLEKFESALLPDGHLFINSSIIDVKPTRTDIHVHYIPVNEVADKLGNAKVGNMVMLGAFVEATKCVSMDSIIDAMKHKLGEKKAKLVPLNIEALNEGAKLVK